MKESILVVDDEDDIVELVRYNLSKAGYRVTCVGTGEEGLQVARSQSPDLVVLDLMLPGIDGLDVCRQLKSEAATKGIPVIMVTARGDEADIVTGLELGADDYLAKPFSPRVLLARIKSVLRRGKGTPTDASTVLKIEGLTINPLRREVHVEQDPVELTNTEFKILHFLGRQPGVVFTRYQIVDGVHGDDYPVTDRSIDVQVVGLRKKLGECGKYVETVRGVGYRFKG
jgi:two-component system alkaline phosphatase synthesis response regulator PhoP